MNIWNCFHGCKKFSDGCKNCYMYFLDNGYTKGKVDSSNVYLVKSQINYPLEKIDMVNIKLNRAKLYMLDLILISF